MCSTIRVVSVKKTRKACWCVGCAIKQPVGSAVEKVYFSDGGEVHCSAWCPVCREYMRERPDEDWEWIGSGDVRAEDVEGWEAVKQRQTGI